MIDVKFNRNRRNALSEIKFESFQGMNCVDNNSVLPAHQVPFAFNVDFGRQIGAASKRFGLECVSNNIGSASNVETGKVKSGNIAIGNLTNISKILYDIERLNLNTVNVPVQIDVAASTSYTMTINATGKANAIALIEALPYDIKVILEPYPVFADGSHETNWYPSNVNTWFYNWKEVVLRSLIDDIANIYDVWALNIASNFVLLEYATGYWKGVIDYVRLTYSGQVIYRTNWWVTATWDADTITDYNTKLNHSFWEYVDIISVAAYFEFNNTYAVPTVAQLTADMLSTSKNSREQNIYQELKNFYDTWGKPVFFGELGFAEYEYCCSQPWNDHPSSTDTISEEAQANGFQVYRNVFEDESWLLGFSVFCIGSSTSHFRVVGSDAERVIYDWYGSLSGVLSQHCFRSSAGDIPLIAHGTDLYKLSGASTTRTIDTEAEFNAGTLTDAVVLSDVNAPSSAPTITSAGGSGSFTGDYYAKVSFVGADGAESELSAASSKLTLSGAVGITWTVPVDSTSGTTVMQRKLYRTKAGGSTYYLVATIDDNTTTTYNDTVAGGSMTVKHPGRIRVILGPGDTQNYSAIITQDYYSNTSAVTPSYTVGQTFTVPAGQRKIYSISPYLLNFEAADSVTLTLYTDTTKATVVSSATLSGAQVSGNVEFILADADVTPGAVYYFELSSSVTGTSVSVRWRGGPVYSGGNLYLNGVSQPNYDMTFKVYWCKYAETGTYESEVIDLTTAPTQATLTFNHTLNGQTVAWYAKCSIDNVVWGDYQAVILSGDGMPLGRYNRVKAVLSSVNGSTTPSITDYMISYNTGYGTATSIKGSLSGSKVRFADWDDRVWFADGVKNFVYDGGFTIAPETVPTVTTSGSGSLPAGTYKCKVAYVNSDSTEGLPCTEVTVTPSGAFLQFNWSAIPTALGYTRKLYRTKNNGAIYYLVATLNATDTTYTDTAADASLTTAIEAHAGHNVLELGSGSTKPPASTIIHIHKNYAFFVEAAVPSRVYVSTVSNPHEIPSASYFQFPSAVLSLKSYDDYLIASGKDFTWYSAGEIWDVDPAVGDWSWKVVSSTIGCIGHEGMIECLDGADNEIIIFPLESGIKYLNANLMGTDLHSVPLSRNVQPYFDQAISREKMSAIFYDMAYYIAFNWSNPATTADNHNNAVFKLDLRNREWSGLWGLDVTGFFVANGDLYMTSSTCGRVYKYAGSDDDGVAIDMIIDSSYVGDAYNKRRFTKAVARIKKGCDTTSSTLLVRCDNTERTITLGANTAWAGAGGSARTVQDEIVSPPKTISGGRAHNVGWRFEDNTVNDMVLYGITIMAEPIS